MKQGDITDAEKDLKEHEIEKRKLKFRLILVGCFSLAAFFSTFFYLIHLPSRETTKNNAASLHDPTLLESLHHQTPSRQTSSSQSKENVCSNLYLAICKKQGITRDPTGLVRPDTEGENLALTTYQEIIRNHPTWTSEEADEEFVKEVYTQKNRGRIEAAYRWVQHFFEKFIHQQPITVFTIREKKQLKDRLRKTELQLPPPASIYSDDRRILTRNDAFYEQTTEGQMRLRVGGAYILTAKSWFNIIYTVAHELSHAIDPCEIRSAHLSFLAYDRLTACFLRNGLIATKKTRSECGQNDQLSETFADWLAVHATAEALHTFSTEFQSSNEILSAVTNAVRDLCDQESSINRLDLEFHPAPEVRIEWVFGRNPVIQKILGCHFSSTPKEYCSFQSKFTGHEKN